MSPLRGSFALFLALAACTSNVKFVYPSGRYPATQSAKASDATIVVTPFVDERVDENRNSLLLCIIPLVPYASCAYTRPEAADRFVSVNRFDCNPPEDLAKATVSELLRQHLVKRTFFSFGGDDLSSATHEIRGTIETFAYRGTENTYCLSGLGVWLWFIGLPAGSSRNTIAIRLELIERAGGKVIWSKRFEDSRAVTQGIYYHLSDDVRFFAPMFERGLRIALADMAPVIGAAPAPLPEAMLNDGKPTSRPDSDDSR